MSIQVVGLSASRN